MGNQKKILEPVIHILIWISVYLILIMLVKTIGPFKRVDQTLIMPVTLGMLINILLFYITSLILIPRFSETKKSFELLLSLCLILGILTIAETLIDKAFFIYYYSNRQESVFSQLLINFIFNFIVLSLALGYGFIKSWFKNEKLKQLLMQEKLTAELNLLRMQLNPHFLFNILNMAFSSASRNGDERTADIIEKLSTMMRYMTYDSNVDRIELEKEVEYIKNYIGLQRMRFSDEIEANVKFQINGDVSGCRITPLILIQFIENTFKHGIKLGLKSEIEVIINMHDRKMEFITRNPIFNSNVMPERGGAGIGIENVRKRLAILYPSKHNLEINNTGTHFIVKLFLDLDQ